MRNLTIAALLITTPGFVMAECSPTYEVLLYGTSETFTSDGVRELYKLTVFQLPAGTTDKAWDWSPVIPKLSVDQPLSGRADLESLTKEDWGKVLSYDTEYKEVYKKYYPEPTMGRRVLIELSKNDQVRNAVIHCWAAKAKSSSTKNPPSVTAAQVLPDKPGPKRELTNAEVEEQMVDADAQMRVLVASRSKKEDADKYEWQQSFLKRQESGGVQADKHRAKIIPPKCIQFKDFGTGITSDVEKVLSSCSVPVAVTYCFHREGPGNGCSNKTVGWGTTGIIRPGGSRVVINPGKGDRWRVDYYVCDMSNPDKVCLKP